MNPYEQVSTPLPEPGDNKRYWDSLNASLDYDEVAPNTKRARSESAPGTEPDPALGLSLPSFNELNPFHGTIYNPITVDEDQPYALRFSREAVDPRQLCGINLEHRQTSFGPDEDLLSSNGQSGSPQFTTTQASSAPKSLDLDLAETKSSCSVDYANWNNHSKQLCSPEIAAADKPVEETYDTCFGMVILKASCSVKPEQTAGRVPVTIRVCGSLLKLYTEVSNKYTGLVDSPALSRLGQAYAVTLAATLILPKRKGNKKVTPGPSENTVEIVIYGLLKDKDAVGNFLSEDDAYLQHPKECDIRVAYINPQYLVRPGSKMPRIQGLTFADASGSASCKEILNERRTNQLFQVFDCANGPITFPEVKPSRSLRTRLQIHQVKALAMMVEKENGILEGSKFKPLWEVSTDLEKGIRFDTSSESVFQGITPKLTAPMMLATDTLLLEVPREIAPRLYMVEYLQTCAGNPIQIVLVQLLNHDIVLTTYDTLRYDWLGRAEDGPLYSEEWARVVLDEAHHIRNRSSKTFEYACKIRSRNRWCLTGTPIHNRLDDYGALLGFLRVPPFMNKASFDHWLVHPISNNKPEGLRRLKKLIEATCLRRTKDTLKNELTLPPRVYREEIIELDRPERELYNFFKIRISGVAAGLFSDEGPSSQHKGNILTLINILRMICDHGERMLPPAPLKAWLKQSTPSVGWTSMQRCGRKCDICEGAIGGLESPDSLESGLSCLHVFCSDCIATSDEEDTLVDEYLCPICNKESTTVMGQPIANPTSVGENYQPTTKVKALLRNIRQEQSPNISEPGPKPVKSVVFSYWTKMLDLIETALESNGFIFQRIDGQKSLEHRIRALDTFNNDSTCTIMLASIGSVAEGVDLTAANHVHLVEPHWNPMVEAQALDRVHRMGQTRDVVTTRYITKDSIEIVTPPSPPSLQTKTP
ncbi:hypothetical protein FQN54_009084 [Arachnomyces sp. PD_36]|nr:hypothetical protein FQN54_009084 [Arachnomyces sp. PD_36]